MKFTFRPLFEEKKPKNDSVVFSFGRNQPPTAGHGHIIDHVVKTAAETGADHVVFTSGSGPDHKLRSVREKNPLFAAEKTEYMRQFFPGANVVASPKVVSPFHAIDHFKAAGYRNIKMVVGADRVAQFRERMAPYAKDFKSFEVISPSEQRIDVKGAEVSGTAARKHAAAGDFKSFRAIMPSGAPEKSVRSLFARLRKPTPPPAKKVKKPTVKKSIIKKKKIAESIINFLSESRPRTAREKTRAYYKKEYKKYQGTKKAIKERSKRVMARRKMIKAGRARVGDGKDVDHKKSLSSGGGNGTSNLRVISRSKNRSRNNN